MSRLCAARFRMENDRLQVFGEMLSKGGIRLPELHTGREITIQLKPPGLRCVRLVGLHFDLEKSFLLPDALNGIRELRRLYEELVAGTLLLVGHTDSSGSAAYNRTLSLERARSVAAFLTDDIDSWLAFYQHESKKKRWGRREDELMLASLPHGSDSPFLREDTPFEDAVTKFQEDHDLKPDGICGPKTRRELITEYMNADDTTLPEGTEIITHGCGEHFPAVKPGDDGAEEINRRVEVFFFPGAIEPEPKSPTSSAGDPFYPAWTEQVHETIDLTEKLPDDLVIRVCDENGNPIGDTHFCARFGNQLPVIGTSDSNGLIRLAQPKVCPEMLSLAWGSETEDGPFDYVRQLFVDCDGGAGDQQALARLHNLGYPSIEDLRVAVQLFQIDHGVDHEPYPVGLVDSDLPPSTRNRLNEEYAKLRH